MIIDACLFAGETDMFELRWRTLRDVVDVFVPVACTLTHQGKPVNLSEVTALPDFGDNGDGLKVKDPYLVTPARNFQPGRGSYAGRPFFQLIERQHRHGVWTAVWSQVTPDVDDIIMVSDVDEIPDPDVVRDLEALLAHADDRPLVLGMRMHSDRLSLLHPYQPWYGTTVTRWHNCEPYRDRQRRGDYVDKGDWVPGAGWHLSWLGTDEQRAWKVNAFSHGEVAETYDPKVGREFGIHSNGEILERIEFPGHWHWPKPLVDGSFEIPPSWLGPCA